MPCSLYPPVLTSKRFPSGARTIRIGISPGSLVAWPAGDIFQPLGSSTCPPSSSMLARSGVFSSARRTDVAAVRKMMRIDPEIRIIAFFIRIYNNRASAMTMQLDDAPAAKPYKVGTLAYDRRGLVTVFVWLLWGDFCLYLMD